MKGFPIRPDLRPKKAKNKKEEEDLQTSVQGFSKGM